MPAAQVSRLSAIISEIVRSNEIRAKIFQQGWQAVGSAPEGLKNRIAADTQALGRIIKDQNIQP
jgi:tripartite-type tricarboxylate transporter receptor subunit TctC